MRRASAQDRGQQPILGIHGGGSIGLGLMADVAKNRYRIVATSSDAVSNELINSNHALYLMHPNTDDMTQLNNITMIPRNRESINELYSQATLLAICLTPVAFNESVDDIAKSIINRYHKTQEKLTILLVMNLPDCERYVTETLSLNIHTRISNADIANVILSSVTFVATVPDRIVTKISSATLENHIPVLYSAEKKFQFYMPTVLEAEFAGCSGITFVPSLSLIETVKNKYINGPHTILAWLGGIVGCKTIAESLQYPHMKHIILRLMDNEIGPILKKAHPDLTDDQLVLQKNLFFDRCMENQVDLVSRVGRNPLSKLDLFGRVVGTLSLRNKYAPTAHLPLLEMAVAAGVVYALKNTDLEDVGCNKIKALYQKNKSYTDVLCHQDEREHKGLDSVKDSALIKRITRNIALLYNPHRFMQMQSFIQSINFFNKENSLKRSAMMLFFNKVGISVNQATGQLSYSRDFVPLKLDVELVFVRHGETYGNAGMSTSDGMIDCDAVTKNSRNHEKRIFQGNVDKAINQLTEQGKQQATAAAQSLFDLLQTPDIIFHSPLQRAKDTGQLFMRLLATHGVECEFRELENIREMSFGAWENRRVCDISPEHPCHSFYQNQNALIKECGENGQGEFHEAENFCEVLLRAHQVLTMLNQKYSGKRIVLFSHSMFGAACFILMGKGNVIENGDYLAFDGKKSDGSSYAIPNATPFFLNRLTPKLVCAQ